MSHLFRCLFLSLFVLTLSPLSPETQAADQKAQPKVKTLEELESSRKKLIAENLPMTAEEARKFWPIYEAYSHKRMELLKMRISYIADLTQIEVVDEAAARKFVDHVLDFDQKTVDLWKQFLPQFVEILDDRKAARYLQIERRIHFFTDAEIGRVTPLIH